MHQSTTPSLSKTIWPRWASRQFLTLPIVQSYDFAQRLSLWDNWGDERGCDECHWHGHTRGLPWGPAEVVGTVQQVHCNRRRLLRSGLEFHVFTIYKSVRTKKSRNLFHDPRIIISSSRIIPCGFWTAVLTGVFSLESEWQHFPGVSRTLLSILSALNGSEFLMVFILRLIFNSTRLFLKLLETVLIIGTTVIFIFHRLFISRVKSMYLFNLLLFKIITISSSETAKFTLW